MKKVIKPIIVLFSLLIAFVITSCDSGNNFGPAITELGEFDDYEIDSDDALSFPTEVEGIKITYSSSNENVVLADGTVVSDPHKELYVDENGVLCFNDIAVITATMTSGYKSQSYQFTVFKELPVNSAARKIWRQYSALYTSTKGELTLEYNLDDINNPLGYYEIAVNPVYEIGSVEGKCTVTKSETFVKLSFPKTVENSNFTVPVVFTSGSLTFTCNVKLTIPTFDIPEFKSLSQILEIGVALSSKSTTEEKYTFRGTVTKIIQDDKSGKWQYYYISDGTASFYAYDVSSYKQAVVVGDYIELTSAIYNYHGMVECPYSNGANPKIITKASENGERIAACAATNLTAWDAAWVVAHQSTLVNINGAQFVSKSDSNHFTFKLGDSEFSVFADSHLDAYADIVAIIDQLSVGSTVNFVEVACSTYDAAQIALTDAACISFELTDRDKVLADAQAISMPTFVVDGHKIALPTVGSQYGSQLTWAIKSGTVATIENNVLSFSEVDATKTVVVTVSVVTGEETETKEYELKVNPGYTVSEYLALGVAKLVSSQVVTGQVVASYNNGTTSGYIITDGTAYLFIKLLSDVKVGDFGAFIVKQGNKTDYCSTYVSTKEGSIYHGEASYKDFDATKVMSVSKQASLTVASSKVTIGSVEYNCYTNGGKAVAYSDGTFSNKLVIVLSATDVVIID